MPAHTYKITRKEFRKSAILSIVILIIVWVAHLTIGRDVAESIPEEKQMVWIVTALNLTSLLSMYFRIDDEAENYEED